jgi:uncharacterized membrane protein YjgN (DUF898 family)
MNSTKYNSLSFHAKPGKLFSILIVNFFYTIITLGLYYPWAKAKLLQYNYSETEFLGSRFVFHGTGKEMFRAYIKVFVGFVLLYGAVKLFAFLGMLTLTVIATVVLYLVVLAIIPLAIHGMLRYRLSRTSWRGIHMGYRGSLKELYKIYGKGLLYIPLTLGFYLPWLTVKMRKYVMSNIRFGNLEFKFEGEGSTLLGLNMGGAFLSAITFYIYIPWYLVSIMNFEIENTVVKQNGRLYLVKSTMKGGSYFGLKFVNGLILLGTLGLGMPFVIIRNMKYHLSNIHFSNKIDMDILTQTESDYSNATGEDLSDALDLNIF